MGLLQVSPLTLKAKCFRHLSSQCWTAGLTWGLELSFLCESLCSILILYFVGCPSSGVIWICTSYLSHYGSFFVSLGSSLFHLQLFCIELWFWVYSWEKVSPGPFYSTILATLLSHSLLNAFSFIFRIHLLLRPQTLNFLTSILSFNVNNSNVEFFVVHLLSPTLCDPVNCSTPGFFCPHSPWVCSNSCPLSQWYHPTISFSVAPFSLALSFSQHQGLFQWIGSSHQVAKLLEFQLQHQSFKWIFRTWFPLELTGLISLLSEGLSKVFSSTTVWKHQFFGTQPSLWFNSHIHTWLLELFNFVPFKIFVHTEKSAFLHCTQMHTYIHTYVYIWNSLILWRTWKYSNFF